MHKREFPFEKLTVYRKAKAFYSGVQRWLKLHSKLDPVVANQLKRAALSIPLNIAEGSGRFTKPDQRNFYAISRSSAFECVAVFDILHDNGEMSPQDFESFYNAADELSRILFAMIQRLS